MKRNALIYNGPKASQSHLAFRVLARAEDRAEILIYDEIGENWYGDGITARKFATELAGIKSAQIDVRINSVGGSVFDGNAMYNALERHPARVETYIDGIAASISSVIALAGEKIHIAENAFFMIHNPHGVAWGEAADMRKVADTLDTVKGSLVGTYAKRTGRSAEEIQAWMDAETWFTAAEAKEHGFVDAIIEGRKIDARIAASASAASFANIPPALAAQIQAAMQQPAAPPPPSGPAAELVQLAAAVHLTLSETRL